MFLEFTEHAIAARCPDTGRSTVKKAFQCVDELNLIFTASVILNKGNAAAGIQKKRINRNLPPMLCALKLMKYYTIWERFACFVSLISL